MPAKNSNTKTWIFVCKKPNVFEGKLNNVFKNSPIRKTMIGKITIHFLDFFISATASSPGIWNCGRDADLVLLYSFVFWVYWWQRLMWFVPVALKPAGWYETVIPAQVRNFTAVNTAWKPSSSAIATTALNPKPIRPLLIWRWTAPDAVIQQECWK